MAGSLRAARHGFFLQKKETAAHPQVLPLSRMLSFYSR